MKKITGSSVIIILIVLVIAGKTGWAQPVAITANEAFKAYSRQRDPDTWQRADVVIVDIRSTAEYYWVGTCAQVDEIILNAGGSITPDWGQVWLGNRGQSLAFRVSRVLTRVPVSDVANIVTSPIAINIPYRFWDEATCTNVDNPNFKSDIEDLAEPPGEVVIILMCRSGGRTSSCVGDFDTSLFLAVYEIDRADKGGRVGFQGSSHNDTFNGYRGFPRRNTTSMDYESVSWCDTGLPIHVGWCPY